MRKPILHRNEKEILRVTYREGRPLTAHEMAVLTGMSWVTAKKYLANLMDGGLMQKQKGDGHPRFIISKELIKRLYERKMRA